MQYRTQWFFFIFSYFLHCRVILMTSNLWRNTLWIHLVKRKKATYSCLAILVLNNSHFGRHHSLQKHLWYPNVSGVHLRIFTHSPHRSSSKIFLVLSHTRSLFKIYPQIWNDQVIGLWGIFQKLLHVFLKVVHGSWLSQPLSNFRFWLSKGHLYFCFPFSAMSMTAIQVQCKNIYNGTLVTNWHRVLTKINSVSNKSSLKKCTDEWKCWVQKVT